MVRGRSDMYVVSGFAGAKIQGSWKRAIYQLQLVKSKEVRKYVPANFKLVELFGYTLGGFYLARYDDSPAGEFDEFVALAGLVWNAPTSCAWAARVYVNNRDARNHGVHHVGLPSRFAAFNGCKQLGNLQDSWWQQQPKGTAGPRKACDDVVHLHNKDRRYGGLKSPVCTLQLPAIKLSGFMGPKLRLSLPSFSGGTVDYPDLVKYSCALHTNIMPISPIKVELPQRDSNELQSSELLDSVLGGRPVLALAFNNMLMTVEEPVKLSLPSKSSPLNTPARAAVLATAMPR
eukprot:jgi/Chrzof1/1046/Cz01g38110.t1